METDEIKGYSQGVTRWNFIWLAVFTFISNWCYRGINRANALGVRPTMHLDLLGINLFTQFCYSFSYKGTYGLWLLPIYGVYMVSGYAM